MAKAVQASAKTKTGSDHVVGFLDLRVMLVQEGGAWFAQGLEIDYIAQGSTLEDAQKAFERGLSLTVAEHLKLFGNIKKLLKPADPDVWEEFYSLSAGKFTFSTATVQSMASTCEDCFFVAETAEESSTKLPFKGIAYLQAA